MADTKTSDESAAATLDGTELIRGVQSAANVKITAAQVVNLAKLQKLSVFAATTSAELASVISNETGSGLLVFATSPTLTTPVLGVAAATSVNKVAITAPATSATLTIADGKTLTVSNTLTFTGTDTSSVAFGTGGTVPYTSNNLSVFAATTSAQLAGVISDETGSGALVFATSPTLVTPVLGVAAGTSLALGGATIGANALAVTGTTLLTGAVTIASASITLSGNISAAAWTTTGLRYKNTAATLTDTSSSGTVAAAYTNMFGGNTIAASSATTFTDYYDMFLGVPAAGTNVTLTRTWALGLAGGLNSTYTSLVSQPAALFSGTVFTGGSATTTKPHVLIEPTGTTSTAWATGGTQFGVNAVSGWAGNLIDLQVAGSSKFKVSSTGAVTSIAGTSQFVSISASGSITARNVTAIPAGGTAGVGFLFSSTANFGVFFGSGAPTLAAAKGSLYLRSDGTGIADRAYINTDGSTTWTNLVTAA